MKLYYDLHIHSCLSPCGDNDMTPNNIVNMASLCELDLISVTDHNCCYNVPAVIECAQNTGIIVIPGMEVETSEEVHVLTFFPDMESCNEMCDLVVDSLPDIKNNVKIFGEQIIMDKCDNIITKPDKLLSTATNLSVYDVYEKAKALGGLAIPAHVDKQSYSILSNLGFFPPDLEILAFELSKNTDKEDFLKKYPEFIDYMILSSSDAHYLEDIFFKKSYLNMEEKSIKAFFSKLTE